MLINLKRLREDAGVSQRTLAENIGVSQQSINKYENHNIEPDIETLVRMADYFDTSVDYLIGHSSERRRQENVRTFDLNEKEAELIENYRKFSARQRESISRMLEDLSP